MTRIFVAALLAATCVTGAGHAMAAPKDRSRECRYQTLDGHRGWTPHEARLTIRCLAPRFAGVTASKALAIADRESGDQATAVNTSSGACGLFQHLPRYWPGRLVKVREARPRLLDIPESCLNARSNTLAAFRMVAADGWSAWGG